MFGLISACAVLAMWLRLRMAYHDHLGWDSIRPLGVLSLGCLACWLARICWRRRATQPTLLAMALLLSAIETVYGILNFSYAHSGLLRPEYIRSSCNACAVVNYGFVFAMAQAAVIVLPVARASVHSRWFLLLVTIITVNLALLILLCNLTAQSFRFPIVEAKAKAQRRQGEREVADGELPNHGCRMTKNSSLTAPVILLSSFCSALCPSGPWRFCGSILAARPTNRQSALGRKSTMTTPSIAQKKPPRRWFAPRFSLRMLMLVVTVAAIGSAVWWRWPITIHKVIRQSPLIEETTTYHRGLWGNLIKHGLYRRTIDGKIEREMHFQEGEVGACEYRTGNTVLAYEWKNRKLISAPHGPRGSLLMQRMTDRSNKLVKALEADVDLDYPKPPLNVVIEDLRERFGLCLALRSRRTEVYEAPIIVDVKGWPMRMGFDAILSPQGLVLDYRYGVLCIVDAEGAADWQDSTGVMELKPAQGTPLAERLDIPAKVTHIELRDNAAGARISEIPPTAVLRNLAVDQDISVELRLEEKDWETLEARDDRLFGLPPEVMNFRDSLISAPRKPLPITLRQLLGLILDKAELHCHEKNGVLIIEPPITAAKVKVRTASP